jgi:type I restriction enzyme S subunit
LSLNGNDEKSYVGRVTTLAGLISDGLFVDGDWVETKDQDPNGEVRLIQLADIGDGTFRDRSSR